MENGTQYYETLRAYVLSCFHPSDAARYLEIHRNSLTYRLDRIREEVDLSVVDKAAAIAHAAGAYVILNPAPAPACALPEALIANMSLITPNQTELALLTGIKGDVEAGIRKLIAMGVKDVIVTLGGKGSAVWNGNGVDIVPTLGFKAVDATAAGDTFAGGVVVALSEGKTLKEAAEFATVACAITIQKLGAQVSIPHRDEVEALGKERNIK